MASKKKGNKYVMLQKMAALASLGTFVLMLVAGLQANVPLFPLLIRVAVVMACLMVLSRILVRVLVKYEEIDSSQI